MIDGAIVSANEADDERRLTPYKKSDDLLRKTRSILNLQNGSARNAKPVKIKRH